MDHHHNHQSTTTTLVAVEATTRKMEQLSVEASSVGLKSAAQRVIRRFFLGVVRKKKLADAVKRFGDLIIPVYKDAKSRKMPFEKLSEFLRRPDVVDAAGDFLERLIHFINNTYTFFPAAAAAKNEEKRKKRAPSIVGTVSVKIFEAAYMIATYPEHVFEVASDKLEQDVTKASTPLLEWVDRIVKKKTVGSWSADVSEADRKALPGLMCTYLRTFKAWKVVDEQRLAGRLKHALEHLEQEEAKLLAIDEADRTGMDKTYLAEVAGKMTLTFHLDVLG
jgi:hypothetical protein